MKKITFLALLLISCSGFVTGQTMVNDFEAGSAAPLDTGGGITVAVVANPNATGLNTTANCLEIKRTAAQWWIYAGIDVDDMTIAEGEGKFLSMMVHFPAQPDLGVRLDAPNDGVAGSATVRALNSYTNLNQWQQIVFEIKDGPTATDFTLGTLFRISIHPDIGNENDPAGQVLNNTDAFGYIDQIQILDANPLSTPSFELEQAISLFPNPAQSTIKVTTRNNVEIESVSVYTLLGKQINNLSKINKNEYDISSLASGMYLVKMTDSNGGIASKKLIKD